jgi:hypothetical protein
MTPTPSPRTYSVQMLELVSYYYSVEAASQREAEELVEALHAEEGGAGRSAEVEFWQVCGREVQS